MAFHTKKTEIREKPSSQYGRLQKLLSFRLFSRPASRPSTEATADDFLDIVLEADFYRDGKVKSIR